VSALLQEVDKGGTQHPAHQWVLDLAVAMAAVGRGSEFLERLPTLGSSTRWTEAAERGRRASSSAPPSCWRDRRTS
jgi:hypothetical protein